MSQSTFPYAGVSFTVDGWKIFSDRERRAFHVVVSDNRFSHEFAQEGLRFVAESSPLSANYNPREFNRMLRAFHDQDQLADWEEIPERERHIARRT